MTTKKKINNNQTNNQNSVMPNGTYAYKYFALTSPCNNADRQTHSKMCKTVGFGTRGAGERGWKDGIDSGVWEWGGGGFMDWESWKLVGQHSFLSYNTEFCDGFWKKIPEQNIPLNNMYSITQIQEKHRFFSTAKTKKKKKNLRWLK